MNKRWIALASGVLVVAVGAGFAWMRTQSSVANAGALEATGTIEDRKAALGSQIGGQVTEVLVEEGQSVEAGQPLIRLDTSLLEAQRKVATSALASVQSASTAAQAAVAAAQAQYDMTLDAALSQTATKRNADWFHADRTDFTKPAWYFSQTEQITAAQASVESAQQALTNQQNALATLEASAASTGFLNAEKDMAEAQATYLVAKRLNDLVSNGRDVDDLTRTGLFKLARDVALQNKGLEPRWLGNNLDQDLRTASQDIFDAADTNLKESQQTYADLITSQAAKDVLKARAEVSVAQERYYMAQDLLRSLRTGSNSPEVSAAQKSLDQAKGIAEQANSAVSQAQANVDLIDTQLAKLTIVAPTDGVVLTRSAEVGQMALPGATLIEIGRLDPLELTVYLPEEQFGLVKPGQSVQARVDAYPDRTFQGTVLRMSNEAEFTPTNVQTKEDRTRLVYGVVIRLNNPDLALKPGMIADVTFPVGTSQ